MAFAIKGQPPMIEKRMCKICGRYDHEEAICYEVIGYHQAGALVSWRRGKCGGRSSRGHEATRGIGQNKEIVTTVYHETVLRKEFTSLELERAREAHRAQPQQAVQNRHS